MQPQNQFPEKKDCFLTFDEIYYNYIEKIKKCWKAGDEERANG